MEHFVIFDNDDAGDGSDNMLEGDKREKKGAAIWRHCSRPEVERGIGPNEWTIRHHQHTIISTPILFFHYFVLLLTQTQKSLVFIIILSLHD